MKKYCKNILIALDQTVNTIFNGEPDETLSARAWRLHKRYWYARVAQILLDLVFTPFSHNHCYESYLSECNRKHLPAEYK